MDESGVVSVDLMELAPWATLGKAYATDNLGGAFHEFRFNDGQGARLQVSAASASSRSVRLELGG
jgi:hypothetical protein